MRLNADTKVLTSVYGAYFDRDWWRQASQSTDCSSRVVDGATSCPVNGRLRQYTTLGLDSRIYQNHQAFGFDQQLEYGVKYHVEHQRRRQQYYRNYDNFLGDVRDASFLQENQARETQALSTFVSNKTQVTDRLTVTPIIRLEYIRNQRIFYADDNGSTANSGSVSRNFTELIPGVGLAYAIDDQHTLYGGIHRGFSPPRVEDSISAGGSSVDLSAERSVNAELGLRAKPTKDLNFDIAIFRNDFGNLVQVGSIAGGSTSYSEGKAIFQGAELAGTLDKLIPSLEGNLFVRTALTWLPVAEQRTAFASTISGAQVPGAVGNRLPYAPENLLNLTLGYRAPAYWNARIDYVYVSSQYSDFANTVAPSTSGQQGLIDAYGIWNVVANYTVGSATLFVTAKNLTNQTYIVDRTRGIQVGMPRTLQAGIKYAF
jgi:Fe(3+) dicitrate transport protein